MVPVDFYLKVITCMVPKYCIYFSETLQEMELNVNSNCG